MDFKKKVHFLECFRSTKTEGVREMKANKFLVLDKTNKLEFIMCLGEKAENRLI